MATAEANIVSMAGRIAQLIPQPPPPPPSTGAVFVQQRPIQNFAVGSTPSSFYKEFNAHFADSDTTGVAVGKIVEWRKNDGTTVISSQADNFVYWPSGRLRTAAVTALYPSALAASGTDTLKGYAKTGTWNNTNWTTTAAITNRDIRAEITISGVTYTFGASNEVTRGTGIRLVRSGPVSACWRINGVFRNGTGINATDEGEVHGLMYLTFFSDGSLEAECRIFSGRGNNATSNSKAVTFYQLKDYSGTPKVFFSYSTSFTFYGATFIDCVDTDANPGYTGTSVEKTVVGFPTFSLADPTTTGLYDAMMMWWPKTTPTMVAALNHAPTAITYTPMGIGELHDIDSTGPGWFIGHMTERATIALFTQAYDAFRQDRINALAESPNCPYWLWDATTGYPYNLNNTAYSGLTKSTSLCFGYGFGGATTVINGGTLPAAGGIAQGASHAGQFAWYQWLATGKEKWLDQIIGQAIGQLACGNPDASSPDYRNALINAKQFWAVQINDQSRAFAWALRNKDNVQWALPDAHVMKQYLTDILTSSTGEFAAYAERLTTPYAYTNQLVLGIVPTSEDVGNGGNVNSATSPWMHDFWAMQGSMSVRRGRITTAHKWVDLHLKLWCYGRGANGCMYGAPCYNMAVGDSVWGIAGPMVSPPIGGDFATAWSQVQVGDITASSYLFFTTNASTASGNVLPFPSTAGIVAHAIIVGLNIPANTTVTSFTSTSLTLSANILGTVPSGTQFGFWVWRGPITNVDGTGCPSSGVSSACPAYGGYDLGANIFQCSASAGKAAGIPGAAAVLAYFTTFEAGQGVTEASWATASNWRWREPA